MHEHVSDSLVGAVIDGRYLVGSRLAHGGMSTVYVATDQRLDRQVALKVMYPHLAQDPSFLERFTREARSAARLSHPNVVGVLDQGSDGSTVYLVMEYVPGHTLRDVLRAEGALSPGRSLDVLEPVLEGLAAAHEAGLVHRDVKPENVLIGTDGRIRIGDFGLARAVSTSTNTGTLIGTVAYLSPELVTGLPADERSDIYSVGIMVYEMLTGAHPFTGDMPIQVAMQHVNSSVPAPSRIAEGIPQDLDELVLCCTDTDPEARPVDGNALLADVRHIQSTLTDAELHGTVGKNGQENTTVLGTAAHTAPLHQPAPGTADPGTPDPGADHRTELVRPHVHPTTVLNTSGRGATPAPPSPPSSDPPSPGSSDPAAGTPTGGPPSSGLATDRARRKDLKALAKAEARSARRPEQTLRRGHPRRRGAIWVAVLLILALLAGGVGWFFGFGPGEAVAVPRVADLTVSQAQTRLSATGLDSTTQQVYDDDVGEGRVVGTAPEAREQVRKYEGVVLFVSRGPQLFAIPDLSGMKLSEATGAVEKAGMTVGEITHTYDEHVDSGTILSQRPVPGHQSPAGTDIDLGVSKGPRPIDVPDVVGLPQAKAEQQITDASLEAEVADERVHSTDVPAGSVASQHPADGQLTRGETVELTLSKGPKMIQVPDLVGLQVDEATQRLEDLGFTVEVDKVLGGFFGTVRAQDPVDATAPQGSTVTLTVV